MILHLDIRTRSFLQVTEWKITFEVCNEVESVVLLDISTPGLNGIEAARRIRQLSPEQGSHSQPKYGRGPDDCCVSGGRRGICTEARDNYQAYSDGCGSASGGGRTRRAIVPICKRFQFSVRNGELSQAAIHANEETWENPYGGYVEPSYAGEMDVYLGRKFTLIARTAQGTPMATHGWNLICQGYIRTPLLLCQQHCCYGFVTRKAVGRGLVFGKTSRFSLEIPRRPPCDRAN